jgi:hypothetical protein
MAMKKGGIFPRIIMLNRRKRETEAEKGIWVVSDVVLDILCRNDSETHKTPNKSGSCHPPQ